MARLPGVYRPASSRFAEHSAIETCDKRLSLAWGSRCGSAGTLTGHWYPDPTPQGDNDSMIAEFMKRSFERYRDQEAAQAE